MELDMEVHHHYSQLPVTALNTVADSLPGLGIVAAVLGVVITMGSLGGPPEDRPQSSSRAGGHVPRDTACYGLLGPMASRMGKAADEEGHFYHVVRVAVISFLKGSSPLVAHRIRASRCTGPCTSQLPGAGERLQRQRRLPAPI